MCQYCKMNPERLIHYFAFDTPESLERRADTCKLADTIITEALERI